MTELQDSGPELRPQHQPAIAGPPGQGVSSDSASDSALTASSPRSASFRTIPFPPDKVEHYAYDQAIDLLKAYQVNAKSLRATCKEQGLQMEGIWWAICSAYEKHDDPKSLYQKYLRAREGKAHLIAEEVIEKSDSSASAAKVRNQIDARKWYAGVANRKTYGNKVEVEQRNVNVNIFVPSKRESSSDKP